MVVLPNIHANIRDAWECVGSDDNNNLTGRVQREQVTIHLLGHTLNMAALGNS